MRSIATTRAAIAVAALVALAGAACGPAPTHSGTPDEDLAAVDSTASVIAADSLVPPDEVDYAGLERVFPEIPQLEVWYREALQAVWNGDLPLAETRSAALDSVLTDIETEENPLAAIYFQSLGARVEKLKDLIVEEQTLQRYLAKVDSLSVISPDGVIDSTALSSLLEQPADAQPSSPRYDLELVENPLTDRWIRFFTGDGRHYMTLWLSRLPRYQDTIYPVLDEYSLPRDLIYLAMIESGLSVKARSVANAVGPWQFIAETGRIYDLRIDWWVDERRNVERSTRAAASHLSDLYEEFHSWPLALAAYNCGARRVQRAIARHHTRDFWKLTSLPSQTRNYVPKFMAALYIAKDMQRYGFDPVPEEKFAYDVVPVEDATDLRLISELCECSLEEIVELNPHVKRWCTPPGERYDVRVPVGKGAQVAERLAQLPPEERITWRRHRVKRGDTLSGLAENYNSSVDAIRDANRLKKRTTLRVGSYLIIPVVASDDPGPRVATYIADAAKHASAASYSRVYVVRRGDTLSRIGRRHGVSVKQLMRWNGKRSAHIRVGERLRVSPPSAD
jgi:membrane-bound lytic murein transglycosylase D